MSKLALKVKLAGLCVALVGMVALVGGVEFFGMGLIVSRMNNIADVQLPAVSNMRMTDMFHDGLGKVVYRALYSAEANDLELKKDVANDLKEYTEQMAKRISNIEVLDVAPDTREALGKAKPKVLNYIKIASEVAGLALTGHRKEALGKLPEFEKAFGELEKDLDDLGQAIERNSDQVKVDATKISSNLKLLSSVLVGFGIVFGMLLSFLIMRDLLRQMNSLISGLKTSSEEILGVSAQGAKSATELSEATTEQAASLQETMASVEEISAMVRQSTDSAAKAQSAVESNKKASDDGSSSIVMMVNSIDEIKDMNSKILEQMESSNKEFSEIVKIIGDIGERTKVINDIVFQTKLLSFNASVEAARAGEHGKGFAVVAEEVGNLAQMSGSAAKEITDMLTSSIKKVNEIVEQNGRRVEQLVEVGRDKIAMGQATARQCQDAFKKIAENATAVFNLIGEIAHASREQAQGIQEINKAVSQLDQVTQQNAAVAQVSASQAEELQTQSSTMSDSVVSLVQFVHGHSDSSAQPSLRENVVPIRRRLPQASVPKRTVKASGTSGVPSPNHSGFEEF